MVNWLRGFLSTNNASKHHRAILEIVNIPIRKTQKASKVLMGHCLFQSVLDQTSLVQVPQEGLTLRIIFAFTRWIHLSQKYTSSIELVSPFWHLPSPTPKIVISHLSPTLAHKLLGGRKVSALFTAIKATLVVHQHTGLPRWNGQIPRNTQPTQTESWRNRTSQ